MQASETGTYHLRYDYVPDVLEKRTPFRPDHLAAVKKSVSRQLIAEPIQPISNQDLQ